MEDAVFKLMEKMTQSMSRQELAMRHMVNYSQDMNKSLLNRNKYEDLSAGNTEEIFKNVEKTEKSYSRTVEHSSKISNHLKQMGRDIKDFAGGVAKSALNFLSIAGIIDGIKDALDISQQMIDVSFQMGEAGKSAQFLAKSVYEVAFATGMGTQAAQKAIVAFKEFRVGNDQIVQLAKNTLRFSEITGVSQENATRLAGELERTGRLGLKATSGILYNMVLVQRAYGLSKHDAELMTDSIITSTKVLGQMGKSSAQIEQFSKGTLKLAASFSSVGVEADKAAKFIDDLLDPGKIEDNALLYAKLGISIQDVIAGNINPDELNAKFKGLGQELQKMSGPAASALAQQLGMSLRDLRALGNQPMDKLNKNLKGASDAGQGLAEAQTDQAGSARELEHTWNRIQDTLKELISKLLPVLAPIIESLTKNVDGFLAGFRDVFNGKVIGSIINALVGAAKIIAGIIDFVFKNPLLAVGLFIAFKIVVAKIKDLLFNSFKEKRLASALTESVVAGVTAGMQNVTPKISKEFANSLSDALEAIAPKTAKELKAASKIAMLEGKGDTISGHQSAIDKYQSRMVTSAGKQALGTEGDIAGKDRQKINSKIDRQQGIVDNETAKRIGSAKFDDRVKIYDELIEKEKQLDAMKTERGIEDKKLLGLEERAISEHLGQVDRIAEIEKEMASKKKLSINQQNAYNELLTREKQKLTEVEDKVKKIGTERLENNRALKTEQAELKQIEKTMKQLNVASASGAKQDRARMRALRAETGTSTLGDKLHNINGKKLAGGIGKGLAVGGGILAAGIGMITQLPGMDKVMKTIMDSLAPSMEILVKTLLPPLLKIASFLLRILGTLVQAIGSLIQTFGGGSGVLEMGNSMIAAADSLSNAADEMSSNNKYLFMIGDILKGQAIADIKEKRNQIIHDQIIKDSTKILGESTDAISSLTSKEIVQKAISTGKEEELKQAIIKNTNELNTSNKTLLAGEMAQAMTNAAKDSVKDLVSVVTKSRGFSYDKDDSASVYMMQLGAEGKLNTDNTLNEINNIINGAPGINGSGIKRTELSGRLAVDAMNGGISKETEKYMESIFNSSDSNLNLNNMNRIKMQFSMNMQNIAEEARKNFIKNNSQLVANNLGGNSNAMPENLRKFLSENDLLVPYNELGSETKGRILIAALTGNTAAIAAEFSSDVNFNKAMTEKASSMSADELIQSAKNQNIDVNGNMFSLLDDKQKGLIRTSGNTDLIDSLDQNKISYTNLIKLFTSDTKKYGDLLSGGFMEKVFTSLHGLNIPHESLAAEADKMNVGSMDSGVSTEDSGPKLLAALGGNYIDESGNTPLDAQKETNDLLKHILEQLQGTHEEVAKTASNTEVAAVIGMKSSDFYQNA